MSDDARIVRSDKGGPEGQPVWGFNVDPHPELQSPGFMQNFSFGVVGDGKYDTTKFVCYLMRRLPGANGDVLNIRFFDRSDKLLPLDAVLYVEMRSPPV